MKAQDRKILLRNSELSPEARFLWCVIESYADKDGRNAFPSVERLQQISGRSDKWVEKYLRELRKDGFISVSKRKHKGQFSHNIYTLSPRGTFGGKTMGKIRTLYQVPYTSRDSLSVESEAILRIVPRTEEAPEKYG